MNVEIVQYFPSVESVPNNTYLGAWAWTTVAGKKSHKWVKPSVWFPDEGGTVGDIVRQYISANYQWPYRRRNVEDHHRAYWKAYPIPQLFRPFKGQAVYIDLKSAFWQIVQRFGVQPAIKLNPGDPDGKPKYLGYSYAADFPQAERVKPVRALLNVHGIGTTYTVKRDDKIQKLPLPTLYKNTDLYAVTVWTLRNIARRARQMGAVYIMSDGFIFPLSREGAFMNYLKSEGWDYAIKAVGYCETYGVGAYAIGDKSTKRTGNGKPYANV